MKENFLREQIDWSNDFCSDMFSLVIEHFFFAVDVSRILLLTQLIVNRTSCRTIQG